MKINLIAVGRRLPDWINTAFETYAKRLPHDCKLSLIEIPAIKRTRTADLSKIRDQETQLLMNALPQNSEIIMLDREGEEINTLTLAQKLSKWYQENRQISLLIGGPEGLSPSYLKKAHWLWSLSQLTFPHPLVRIIVIEQLYRSWSIMKGHPYHR